MLWPRRVEAAKPEALIRQYLSFRDFMSATIEATWICISFIIWVGNQPTSAELVFAAMYFSKAVSADIPAATRLTIESALAIEPSATFYTFPERPKINDTRVVVPDINLTDAARCKTEPMLYRIALYARFLKSYNGVNVIFTDLDQLFVGPFSPTFAEMFDVAVVHKRHGTNAGLYLAHEQSGKNAVSFFEDIYEVFATRFARAICKGGHSCTTVGGEQLATDALLVREKSQKWTRDLSDWKLETRYGKVWMLDPFIYNAVPGRFEVIPQTKCLHFMGYRKSCMERYARRFFTSGLQSILTFEGYSPSRTRLTGKRRRLYCMNSKACSRRVCIPSSPIGQS